MWVEHMDGAYGLSMRVGYMGGWIILGQYMWVQHEEVVCGCNMRVVYVGVA
ncbi:hypothetical protein DPMN_139917 [Dreissena polymorpha]|uniref:Uncharacterized protein n=1 Tax=Dreissena polymorpha TaxID=45954 RepID=A0A9D4JL87_DREPO|nr:hypothetical protein DPMN_139917 [Dreissena polymorpha]